MGRSATITKTGQITLPKWVREALGVSTGEQVVFRRSKKGITLEREKTAEEIADEIHALIPDEIREKHMRDYAGLTAKEMTDKWLKTDDAKAYFEEEERRCL